MTRLLVVRHGRTVWNATGRVQGQSDIPLDEIGEAQAQAAAPLLAARRPDLIVSSDLGRAARTAAPVGELTGLLVQTDPRLRERGYGDWEGMNDTDIEARWPDAFHRWRTTGEVDANGVEPLRDVGKRAGEALRAVAEQVGDGTAVVVTHAGAARRGIGSLLDWPPEAVRTLGALDNGHWADLVHGTRGWRLAAYNIGAVA